MKILGIETSCDETAVCLVEFEGSFKSNSFEMKILGNALHSQVESHKEYGGVVPMIAKREHAKNLIPLLTEVLKQSIPPSPYSKHPQPSSKNERTNTNLTDFQIKKLEEIFGRELGFKDDFIKFAEVTTNLPINAIAVTHGPGLEPALWMGIIFTQALSLIFDIPIIPVNHMEGHILSALPKISDSSKVYKVQKEINFPIISLLISGGHTELVLMKDWHSYEIIGETRDDAVGEAFDKVARMLDLPYPGGPEISKLAQSLRNSLGVEPPKYILPRPMINSKDYDFSFSGLKTAVLYGLKKENTPKEMVAKEFEDAVSDVLVYKTLRAIEEFNAKTLILGGGVVSNNHIRSQFEEKLKSMLDVELLIPELNMRTDNALMIAIAGYENFLKGKSDKEIQANGTLKIA